MTPTEFADYISKRYGKTITPAMVRFYLRAGVITSQVFGSGKNLRHKIGRSQGAVLAKYRGWK